MPTNETLQSYKLDADKWNTIYLYQKGKCAICDNQLKKANIDHDHYSGLVRGLLCFRCNRALGLFLDNISLVRRALAYLLKPPATIALNAPHYGFPGRIGTKKHRKLLKEWLLQCELFQK